MLEINSVRPITEKAKKYLCENREHSSWCTSMDIPKDTPIHFAEYYYVLSQVSEDGSSCRCPNQSLKLMLCAEHVNLHVKRFMNLDVAGICECLKQAGPPAKRPRVKE